MLAVGILGMMSLAIYRFVQTNITALRIQSETSIADQQYAGFANLLTAQFQSLIPGQGQLLGEPFKFNDRPRDEITWVCDGGGPGVVTRYADDEYRVSMRLRPVSKESDRMEIGLARKSTRSGDFEQTESWVPLLPDVQSLQIRYFDPRLNTWVDRWTDTLTLPRLVKVVIGRPNDSTPWEAIIPLGRTPL
jgi:hypothetical protein